MSHKTKPDLCIHSNGFRNNRTEKRIPKDTGDLPA